VSGLDAALRACAVADRSSLARLIGTGPDLLGLLHRLSTGDVKDLRPGEGRETVVTNAKGRIVERLFVHHLGDDGVLLVGGPGGATRILDHLKRFTFAERTGLSDVTASTFALALVGPRWSETARAAGLPDLPPFGCAPSSIGGARIHAARTNGFDAEGALVVGRRDDAPAVLAVLLARATASGGGAINDDAFEAWRILQGLPASGHELTEEHNPLEAGLRSAVSFTKGCYVGQEVVARLNTYGKVARALVRLELDPGSPVPAVGDAIVGEGGVVGAVTSAALPPGGGHPVALGYVKSRDVGPGVTTLSIDHAGALRNASLVRG
jgi:folate-binding protein YgfZ